MKLSKQVETIATLKGAMYGNGNVTAFLEKAIKAYEETAHNQQHKTIVVTVNDRQIEVKNTPLLEYNGQSFENVHLGAALEDVLTGADIAEVDFTDLIQKGEVLNK